MINPERFYAELGRKIYLARKKADITQDELAVAVGLSRTSITNIERGRQKLLLHSILDFAHALKVHPGDLIPEMERSKGSTHQFKILLRSASASPAERDWAESAYKTAS